MAAGNGALVDLAVWKHPVDHRAEKGPSRGAIAVLMVIIGNAIFGGLLLKMRKDRFRDSCSENILRVAMVQSNVAGREKWRGQHYKKILKMHLDLSEEARTSDPELIVWSEGALGMIPSSVRSMVPTEVRVFARKSGIPILMGGSHTDHFREQSCNSATVVSPSGRLVGRYDKVKLFPFSEEIPRGLEFVAGTRPARFFVRAGKGKLS